jgi:O-antigen/teichoic acid export membrane protein
MVAGLSEAPPLRHSVDAPRERRQFIMHNALAAGGTCGAGLFGLALQAIVSHQFRPAEYGEAFAVFSFFTILTLPAFGFGNVIAWSTSRDRVSNLDNAERESGALLRVTNLRLLLTGTLIALAFIAAAPLVAAFLHVPSSFVILGALGVPFLLAAPPLLAVLQGDERWVSWSVVSMAIAGSRVVCVLAFVIPFGVSGMLLGISVAAALVYLGLLAMVWSRVSHRGGRSGWLRHWRLLVLSLASAVAISVAMGSDVVMVQHFFGAQAGGQFSSVAVITRTMFFVFGSVGSVLFPKIAARHATARSTKAIVGTSVAIAVLGSVAGLIAFSIGGHLILQYFSGRAYEGGAGYIGWYAVGMPLLAAVTMLTQTQQSLSDLGMLWVLIPGTLLKPVLILFFHQSLLMVSLMSDVSISVLLFALAVRYLMLERRRMQAILRRNGPGTPLDQQSLTAMEPVWTTR